MVLPPSRPRFPDPPIPATPTMIEDTIRGTINIFSALRKSSPTKAKIP
jgi:hypothetical protein